MTSFLRQRCAALLKALLAGFLIGIGGMVFLACDNRYVGALLFSVALLSILLLKFNLYTGMIGYVTQNGLPFAIDTLIAVFGNFLGAFVAGWIRPEAGNVVALCEARLQKPVSTVLFDAFLCGIMIFLCVEPFKKKGMVLPLFLCIPTFILCGFEHCIADAFYFASARLLTAPGTAVFLLLAILGNAAGGLFLPLSMKLIGILEEKKEP